MLLRSTARRNFARRQISICPALPIPPTLCFIAWQQWRRDRLLALIDLWNRTIRAINPESSCIPNNGGGALSSLDSVAFSNRAPMLVADRQGRSGLAAPWLIGKTAKEFRATMGTKPAIGLFGVGLEERTAGKTA